MPRQVRRCLECKKVSMGTREEARLHLAGMLRYKEKHHTLKRKGMHALNTYRCPYGNGWHIGRDHRILDINFKRGRIVNLEKIEPKTLTKTPPKRRKAS